MPSPIQSLPPTTILTKENTGEYVEDPNSAAPGSVLDLASKGVVFIQEVGGSTVRWYKNADGSWKKESEAQSLVEGENINIVDDGFGNFTISADVPVKSITGSGDVLVTQSSPGMFGISASVPVKSLSEGSNVTIEDMGSGNFKISSDASSSITGLTEGDYISITETIVPGTFEISASPPVKTLVEGNSISITPTDPGVFQVSVSGDLLIPDATPEVSGKVNITTQEFGGDKTFRGSVTIREDADSSGLKLSSTGPSYIYIDGESELNSNTLYIQNDQSAPEDALMPKISTTFETGDEINVLTNKFGVVKEYDFALDDYDVKETLKINTSSWNGNITYPTEDPGTPLIWAKCKSVSTSGTANEGSSGNLLSVFGIDSNNIWAVGNFGKIIKWNGSSWSTVYSGTAFNFNSVWGSSTNNIVAVGDSASSVRWNGSVWTSEPITVLESDCDVNRVWGFASNNYWIIADSGETSLYISVYNYRDTPASDLYGIWGAATNDIWAAGVGGSMVHWDGNSWSSVVSGVTSILYSVWGTSTSNVWAVGEGGTILHWDGNSWSSVSSGTVKDLKFIWGISTSDVWVVGEGGTILHWDGNSWSSISSGTPNTLNSIWGSSATNVFAVGDGGVIIRWNGSSWSSASSGFSVQNFTPYSSSAVWDFTQWNYENNSVPTTLSSYVNSFCLCPETVTIPNPSYDPENPNNGLDPEYINSYRDVNGNYENTPLRTWGYGNLGSEYMGGCYLENGSYGVSDWTQFQDGFTISFWVKPYTPSGSVPFNKCPIFWHSFNNTKQGVDRFVWGDDISVIPYDMVSYWPDDYTGMASWGIFYHPGQEEGEVKIGFEHLSGTKEAIFDVYSTTAGEWTFVGLKTTSVGTFYWDTTLSRWVQMSVASTRSIDWDYSGRWTIGPPPSNPGTVSLSNYGKKLRNYDNTAYMDNTNDFYKTGNPDFGATSWPRVSVSDIRVYQRSLDELEMAFLSGVFEKNDVNEVERTVNLFADETTLYGDLIVKDPAGINSDLRINYYDFQNLSNLSTSSVYGVRRVSTNGVSRVFALDGNLKVGLTDDIFDYTKALTADGDSDFNGSVNILGSSNYLYSEGSVGVGIGPSTVPLGQLQVNKNNSGGLGGEIWVTNSAAAAVNNAAAISFGVDSSVTADRVAARIMGVMVNSSTKDSELVFSLYNSSSASVEIVMKVSSSGLLAMRADGSAAAPVLSFGSIFDSDTGIFHPAENTLAISTGGTERFRVSSAGNVGIGTTIPTFKLDINGNIRIIGDDGSNKLLFGGTGAGDADVNLYKSAANTLKTDNDFISADITTGTVTISGSTASRWRGALAAAPGSGNIAGDLYYDTVLLKLYVYDGSNWQAVA